MSLLSFTAQWIDSQFNLKHATLQVQNFRGSHTADRQDVQVRWNSSLYMLQSILEKKRALSVYGADYSLPATLTANHPQTCLSREKTTDQGVRTMKSTLLEAVETRFAEVEEKPLYSIATLVDPRYKDRQVQFFTKSGNLRLATDNSSWRWRR
ncbi:hypothetical protein F7725_019095 [Dissostichus mawsoni]|uniref:Uncharacterized protein n=1 Tax=Dissostichus mawsoni TaxID=36200 RepID=A0A7J5XW87_DISMA|nr:hypothetical protein F7725_019095 [Dissostichus mawsoni]